MRKNLLLSVGLVLAAAAVAVIAPIVGAFITPSFTVYQAPSSLFDANNAGEPSVGDNWLTNHIMYEAGTSTFKVVLSSSSPPTATWSDVTPTNLNAFINLDPILATDSSLGRTYAGGLEGSCSAMSFSNNDGTSWTPDANSCSGTVDHETIGAGPWLNNVVPAGATYSHAVYYCAQFSEDACSRSLDGGLTFANPTPVLGSCGSLHGHVKVASTGVAFLPNGNCGNNGTQIGGGITTNNGLTWNSYVIPGAGERTDFNNFDPSVGTTASGWAWEAWQGADNHLRIALTKNNGTTWTNMTDISAGNGVLQTTMPAVVAGKDSSVAVAYLGSTTSKSTSDGMSPGFSGTWDLYVSVSYDTGKTWTTVKVTSDPVQRGYICASGTTCGSGRNLLDFIDATTDVNGNIVVAYADGCINACAGPSGTVSQSTSAWASLAVQTGGTPLK